MADIVRVTLVLGLPLLTLTLTETQKTVNGSLDIHSDGNRSKNIWNFSPEMVKTFLPQHLRRNRRWSFKDVPVSVGSSKDWWNEMNSDSERKETSFEYRTNSTLSPIITHQQQQYPAPENWMKSKKSDRNSFQENPQTFLNSMTDIASKKTPTFSLDDIKDNAKSDLGSTLLLPQAQPVESIKPNEKLERLGTDVLLRQIFNHQEVNENLQLKEEMKRHKRPHRLEDVSGFPVQEYLTEGLISVNDGIGREQGKTPLERNELKRVNWSVDGEAFPDTNNESNFAHSSVEYLTPEVEYILSNVKYTEPNGKHEAPGTTHALPKVEYVVPRVDYIDSHDDRKMGQVHHSLERYLEHPEVEIFKGNGKNGKDSPLTFDGKHQFETFPKQEMISKGENDEGKSFQKVETGRTEHVLYILSSKNTSDNFGGKEETFFNGDGEFRNEEFGNFEDNIYGVAHEDFPAYDYLPATGFNCADHPIPGYYGDVNARCQVFHVCHADGRQSSFLCPTGTVFHQRYLVCDWWYNVDCSNTPQFYRQSSIYFDEDKFIKNIKAPLLTINAKPSTIKTLQRLKVVPENTEGNFQNAGVFLGDTKPFLPVVGHIIRKDQSQHKEDDIKNPKYLHLASKSDPKSAHFNSRLKTTNTQSDKMKSKFTGATQASSGAETTNKQIPQAERIKKAHTSETSIYRNEYFNTESPEKKHTSQWTKPDYTNLNYAKKGLNTVNIVKTFPMHRKEDKANKVDVRKKKYEEQFPKLETLEPEWFITTTTEKYEPVEHKQYEDSNDHIIPKNYASSKDHVHPKEVVDKYFVIPGDHVTANHFGTSKDHFTAKDLVIPKDHVASRDFTKNDQNKAINSRVNSNFDSHSLQDTPLHLNQNEEEKKIFSLEDEEKKGFTLFQNEGQNGDRLSKYVRKTEKTISEYKLKQPTPIHQGNVRNSISTHMDSAGNGLQRNSGNSTELSDSRPKKRRTGKRKSRYGERLTVPEKENIQPQRSLRNENEESDNNQKHVDTTDSKAEGVRVSTRARNFINSQRIHKSNSVLNAELKVKQVFPEKKGQEYEVLEIESAGTTIPDNHGNEEEFAEFVSESTATVSAVTKMESGDRHHELTPESEKEAKKSREWNPSVGSQRLTHFGSILNQKPNLTSIKTDGIRMSDLRKNYSVSVRVEGVQLFPPRRNRKLRRKVFKYTRPRNASATNAEKQSSHQDTNAMSLKPSSEQERHRNSNSKREREDGPSSHQIRSVKIEEKTNLSFVSVANDLKDQHRIPRNITRINTGHGGFIVRKVFKNEGKTMDSKLSPNRPLDGIKTSGFTTDSSPLHDDSKHDIIMLNKRPDGGAKFGEQFKILGHIDTQKWKT